MSYLTDDIRIANILDQPDAPKVVARLNTALEEEKKRRQQFYADYNDDQKVEFINGEVIVHSPAKLEHLDASGRLYALMNTFVELHQLGKVTIEKAMLVMTRNDYEPDVVFWRTETAQNFKKGQWKFPVPDFVAEVLSDSTEKTDRNAKFKDYEAHGVREYWLLHPVEEWIEQYFLQDGKFVLHKKSSEGMFRSPIVKGFAVDVDSIFDVNAHLEALRQMFLPN